MRSVVITLVVCALGVYGLGCLDDNGNPIDWSVMMKVPKISGNSNPTIVQGLAYLYTDPNTTYELSPKSLQQNQDAAAYTLSQLYGSSSSRVGWIIYNDEGSSGPDCGYCGHTKGVLGFDANGAFWLIHSVPKYPPAVNGGGSYAYPDSGTDYGQSFLCTTLPFSSINDVARQMLFTAPNVYDSNLPSSLASELPGVNAIIQKQHITVSNVSVNTFTTVGGNEFTHYAKTAAWNQDLYEGLIAPGVNDNLLIETWMRPNMPSFCPPTYQYAVQDIESVTLWPGVTFAESKDHSKWAISQTAAAQTVCIGDINHQPSQFNRAGGSMCFNFSSEIWSLFNGFVAKADMC